MKMENRQAYRNYEILETVEAGVVLSGAEAKSIREGRLQLGGAYVRLREREAWLVNAVIPRFAHAGGGDLDKEEARPRKLLLKKSELLNWQMKVKTKGVTLVPLSVYSKGNLVKVEVGLVKGRREYEKRDVIKQRQWEREEGRILKQKN